MNKKGFTLIELLATLVIIVIVMGIVLPSASRVSQENQKRIYQEYENMMVEYALVSPLRDRENGIIDLTELEELGKIKNDCSGYVERISKNPYQFTAHIKCPKKGSARYISASGFDSSFIIKEPGYIVLSSQSGSIKSYFYGYFEVSSSNSCSHLNSNKGSKTLSFSVSSHHGGNISCQSSNTSYATCSVSGKNITITKMAGNSTAAKVSIVVTSGETDEYAAASATFVVYIYAANNECSTSIGASSPYGSCSSKNEKWNYAAGCSKSGTSRPKLSYNYCCLSYIAPQ